MPENPDNLFYEAGNKPTIANLYPDLSFAEQTAAEEKWRRYLRIVRRIFEYVSEENPEILTELARRVILRKKRANKK